jgi:hypothetical protein
MYILKVKEVLIIAQCEIELEHTPPCMNLLFSLKEYTRLFACFFFLTPLIVFIRMDKLVLVVGTIC